MMEPLRRDWRAKTRSLRFGRKPIQRDTYAAPDEHSSVAVGSKSSVTQVHVLRGWKVPEKRVCCWFNKAVKLSGSDTTELIGVSFKTSDNAHQRVHDELYEDLLLVEKSAIPGICKNKALNLVPNPGIRKECRNTAFAMILKPATLERAPRQLAGRVQNPEAMGLHLG